MAVAALLTDGRVLAAGGNLSGGDNAQTRAAEIYDPGTDSWALTGSMNVARNFFSATRLTDGRVPSAAWSANTRRPRRVTDFLAPIRQTGGQIARVGFGCLAWSGRRPVIWCGLVSTR